MSRELAYLLLICGLLVVPGLLQRLRIPPPLSCFLLGLAVILSLTGGPRHDDAVHLLAALTPTLIFTLVLASILRERGAISDEWFGGLLLYAGLNTLLPSFVLRASFDVAPSPLEAARQIGARDAEHRDV